jgi:hypothetical protein
MKKVLFILVWLGNLQAFAQFTPKNIDSLAAALNACTYRTKLVTSFAPKKPDWYSNRVAKFEKKDKVIGISQEGQGTDNNFYVFSLQSLVLSNQRLRKDGCLLIPLKKEGIENSFFREDEASKSGRMVSEITINVKPEATPEEVQKLLRLFRKCMK